MHAVKRGIMKFIRDRYYRHRERINNFLWRSLQIFSRQGFSFIMFIIFAKFLVPYEYGIYGYVTASVFLLTLFADFGISGSTAKFVAEYSTKNKSKMKRLLFNSCLVVGSASVLIILITLLFGRIFMAENYKYFIYTIPILFFAPLTGVYQGMYTGLKKFKTLSIFSVSIGIISLISNFILIKNYGLYGALIGQNIQHILLFIVLALGLRDNIWQIDKEMIIKVSKYALIIGITTLSYYLYTRADIVILGKFGYIKEIAYYTVINKIFEMIILPFSIYALVSGPNMTALYVKKKYEEVRADFLSHVKALIILGIAIAAASYFIIPPLIKIFFEQYFNEEALYIFKLLLIILPIRMMAAYVSSAHTGPTGNAHYSMWPMIIAGTANVILDIYFISIFGFIGVVYSTLICYTFAISAFTINYSRKLRRLTNEKT
jgi:O-antigen/teichoic acid export membrane protein